MSRPEPFLTLSDESSQSFFFDPLVQKVLLSGSIKFSAIVKFSKVVQRENLIKLCKMVEIIGKINSVQNRQ